MKDTVKQSSFISQILRLEEVCALSNESSVLILQDFLSGTDKMSIVEIYVALLSQNQYGALSMKLGKYLIIGISDPEIVEGILTRLPYLNKRAKK